MKVTEEVQYVFSMAKMIAREYQNETYSPSHMIRAVLNDEKSVIPCLELLDKDVPYLKEWADVRIETYPKGSGKESDPVGDVRVGAVMEEAEAIMHSVGLELIDPLCVLAAICRPNVAFTKEQLKSLTLTADDIIGTFILNRNPVIISENSFNRKSDTSNNQSLKAIKAYCIDKTLLARDLKIDPIVGRDRETRMMIEILGRRSKPNVLITGEPGVGKTALVDGFALSIISNDVPAELESCQLFELDLGSLVAGSGYKGEIEDRLKKVLKEIKSLPRAIIFIDEIHSLLDSNGPFGSGVANILKPELARGEITIIGATTNDEYRKFIEPEQAFNRRFEVLKVEEPDILIGYLIKSYKSSKLHI